MQTIPEFEQVTGSEGQPEFVCTIRVGPEDRLEGRGRGPNIKSAKQKACQELLTVRHGFTDGTDHLGR